MCWLPMFQCVLYRISAAGVFGALFYECVSVSVCVLACESDGQREIAPYSNPPQSQCNNLIRNEDK